MIAGGFLALVAAACFAANNASFRRGALTGSVAQAMALSLSLGLLWFLLAVLATGAWQALSEFPPLTIGMLCSAGLLHFAWGRYCNFRATKAMGANLVGPVQQSGILITLALAVLILNEALTPLRIIGILLVIAGPMVSLRARRATIGPDAAPTTFQPNYVEGYTFAALSALGMGASPVLVRLSLENAGLAASLAGGLVAYAAAAFVMALGLLAPGAAAHIRAVDRKSAAWFVASALLVATSQMFGYMALALAPVTVVTPIQRLSLVFRVYANSMLNRQHEVVGGRIWIATTIALLGALALSLSTETVLQFLPLPPDVAAAARWQWP